MLSDIKTEELEKELIEDIEKDLIGWSGFITSDDRKEIIVHNNSDIK